MHRFGTQGKSDGIIDGSGRKRRRVRTRFKKKPKHTIKRNKSFEFEKKLKIRKLRSIIMTLTTKIPNAQDSSVCMLNQGRLQ